MEKFKSVISVLRSFGEPALGDDEWKEIKDLIASDTTVKFYDFRIEDFNFKLKDIYALQMINFKDEISNISVYSIYSTLLIYKK